MTICSITPGEIRLNGVEVGLFDASASLLISTETDFNGNYAFSGLPAGSYFLAFSAPGIIGHPIVGAGTNGLTAPFDLSVSQNYELNVGYIIDLSTDNINGTTSPLALAQVAPQPASDWLQIDFYSQYTEPTLLQIYNLHGSLLYQSTVEAQSGYGNSTRLDLANYSSGMYILLLQNRYAQLTQKITKL
ncbi:MAG: T9SS type A sorting domain-containing protein [Sphingobacteriales bacterium]|nr:T9SS type A sorting domain-containing protein [Sphingobacteriales bacterium]